jgi:hypothetical protein
MTITPEHDKALSYHPLTPGRGDIHEQLRAGAETDLADLKRQGDELERLGEEMLATIEETSTIEVGASDRQVALEQAVSLYGSLDFGQRSQISAAEDLYDPASTIIGFADRFHDWLTQDEPLRSGVIDAERAPRIGEG